MTTKPDIKTQLFNLCLEYVDARINAIQIAIANANESANDDTKSSAGDKHETGRAMAQLEQEKCSKQLKEAEELRGILLKINLTSQSKTISKGSIVTTDKGNFFISIAANKLKLDDIFYFAISANSPIGELLIGKTINEQVNFNGQVFTIQSVN